MSVEKTVFACANLNYGRDPEGHARDVAEMRRLGADVICTQEDLVDGKHRERIRVRGGLSVRKKGSILALLDRRGFKIGPRRIVWNDMRVPGIGLITVFDLHMPPMRMKVLQPFVAARLRRLIRAANKRRGNGLWLAAADWNERLADDPAGLEEYFDAAFYGEGIDGFAASPALQKYVRRCWTVDRPLRDDGHPFVYLALAGEAR